MIALTATIGGLMFIAYLANLWVFQRATRRDPLTTASAQSPECLIARRYVGVYVRRP